MSPEKKTDNSNKDTPEVKESFEEKESDNLEEVEEVEKEVEPDDQEPSGSDESPDDGVEEELCDDLSEVAGEAVAVDEFSVGDTVRLHYTVTEAGKKRIQPFEGLVIAMKGNGQGRTFTVRRIARGGIGVERIIPLHSPLIKRLEVLKKGNVRRSKLYYLRDRIGRQALKVRVK